MLTTLLPSVNQLSGQLEIFEILQPSRPPRPVKGIAFLMELEYFFVSEIFYFTCSLTFSFVLYITIGNCSIEAC
jgi:hypothetical protein